MRIHLSCLQCNKTGEPVNRFPNFYRSEVEDSGLFQLTCSNGHESLIGLQEQKFEILFDLAILAISDGYYREAVSSFSAALERYYEFYIRVISTKHSIVLDKIDAAWKLVANQSERQFGAYAFAYLFENKKVAPTLPESQTAFRNKVIHKGTFPTRVEAVEYGEAVLQLVWPSLEKLKQEHQEYVTEVVLDHVQKLKQKIKGNPSFSQISIPTTLSISVAYGQPQPRVVDRLLVIKTFYE